MKTKVLGILIVIIVLFCLQFYVLTFVIGCKEKVEARAKSVGITFTDCNFVTTEPNEPESESLRYSLPIPTWPDYIELEKELVIEMPYPMWYGRISFKNFAFHKGTKIYFKED